MKKTHFPRRHTQDPTRCCRTNLLPTNESLNVLISTRGGSRVHIQQYQKPAKTDSESKLKTDRSGAI